MMSIGKKEMKKKDIKIREIQKKYDFDNYSKQDISYYYCQAGFNISAPKKIVIWTLKDYKTGVIKIVNNEKTINREFIAQKQSVNEWGRYEWICDISNLEVEGQYSFYGQFDNEKGPQHSINIDNKLYLKLLEKSTKHLFLKRCGIYCHLNDGIVYSHKQEDFGKVIKKIDVSGGWHDAHDDNKWMTFIWHIIDGLLNAYESLEVDFKGVNNKIPYLLEEAKWEMDFMLKMQKEDGSFYSGVFEYNPIKKDGKWIYSVHDTDNEYDDMHDDKRLVLDLWGENKVCKIMGRDIATSPSSPYKYFAYFAYNMLRFARLYKQHDTKYANNMIEKAKLTLFYLKDKTPKFYQYLDYHSALSLCYLELNSIEKDKKWKTKNVFHLGKVLEQSREDGLFNANKNNNPIELEWYNHPEERPYVDGGFWYMVGIIRYMDTYKNEELYSKCKGVLTKLANLLQHIGKSSVWNHVGEITIDKKPQILAEITRKNCSGYNGFFATISMILASATRLTDNNYEVESLANLEWILGSNPRFVSYMIDVGIRNIGDYEGIASRYQKEKDDKRVAFYRHRRDLRYGITNGIRLSMDNNLVWPECGGVENQKYHYSTTEEWIYIQGWFINALVEISKMRDNNEKSTS